MMSFEIQKEKVRWVREEMLKLHKLATESRIASCLSDIEIFVTLYYGDILNYNPHNPQDENRDRFIISKGHGAVSLYPILADLGFFEKTELQKIGEARSFLCTIPDTFVPGFETINGSLGHGLGVGCGIALAVKRKKQNNRVFVLCGDGELNEGSVWEAVMFAAFHQLNNLCLIIDNNKISMLGYQKDILGLEPLDKKFKAFGWKTKMVDGHSLEELHKALDAFKRPQGTAPKVLIANTRKGKGIPELEGDPLCHVKNLKPDDIDNYLTEEHASL